MREKTIEKFLCDKFKRVFDNLCYKFNSANQRGVPDRIALPGNGRVVFVEVKAPDGRLSTLQQKWISKHRAMGYEIAVVSSKEEVTALIEGMKE